jgi:hypothetical protein
MPEESARAHALQQISRYLRLEELDLATLARYAEAIELRGPAELVDDLLAASLEHGVILPVVVTEDGKIVDGYRRVAALLARYKQPAERRAVRVPALVISREVRVPPEALRFVAVALQRPAKSVEQCSAEMVDALVRRAHYSLVDACPVCKAALLLDAYDECGPQAREPCIPPGMKRAVRAVAARCVELLERVVLYRPPDAASRELARMKSEFAGAGLRVHPDVERLARSVEERARRVLETAAAVRRPAPLVPETPGPPLPAAPAGVTPRAEREEAQRETARAEETAEREETGEVPLLEGEVPEDVRGSLLYIERLVTETAREEVERAVERKRRLYTAARTAGMPDSIARLVVYLFNADEVEQVVASFRQMPDRVAFVRMLAERADSFRGAKSLTVTQESLSRLVEMAHTYAYPLPFLVQDVIDAVYARFSAGEYKTLRELLDAVAGRGA